MALSNSDPCDTVDPVEIVEFFRRPGLDSMDEFVSESLSDEEEDAESVDAILNKNNDRFMRADDLTEIFRKE